MTTHRIKNRKGDSKALKGKRDVTVEIEHDSHEIAHLIEVKQEMISKIQELENEISEIDINIEKEYTSKSKPKTENKSNDPNAAAPATLGTHFWEKRRYVLLFGIIIGILITFYSHIDKIPNDIIPQFEELINLDSSLFDKISIDAADWKGYLPDGLLQTLQQRKDEESNETGAFSIGKLMKKDGLTADHNVIMVPGVVSTGIESWGVEGTAECPGKLYFRKRLWGSFFMLRTMLMEKSCWLKHIMLDEETGLDPPGYKLRAAQGFEAADFFVAGYWIWNKILENLAVIGYGPDNMYSASYDWRLAYLDLERRDGYFSKLKSQIELSNKLNNKKTVLMGHSMGAQIVFFFLKWVEASGYGNGGKSWVNDNIAAYVDISGSMLGTPKAITALLSGEMKDTVQLNRLAVYGLEKFFSRKERSDMLKTFGGIPSMLPKGGDLIWGDMDSALDDISKNDTFGNFIRFTDNLGEHSQKNLTVADSIDFLLDQGPAWFKRRVTENYSYGYAKTKKELAKNAKDYRKWSNPLEVPLPYAPDLKVYCFYGVGKPTERAYYYKEENSKISGLNVTIDAERKESVLMSDGDGTVSLLTHSMCHQWKMKGTAFNPGGASVTIVEIEHDPDSFDIRGGAKTAEHVDILGSAVLNEMLLKVASGKGAEIEDVYKTNLKDVVEGLSLI